MNVIRAQTNFQQEFDLFRTAICKCDDNAGHHLISVNDDGDISIKMHYRKTQVKNISPDIKYFLNWYDLGNGYVGPAAAQDTYYMLDVFTKLIESWKSNETGYVDMFITTPARKNKLDAMVPKYNYFVCP